MAHQTALRGDRMSNSQTSITAASGISDAASGISTATPPNSVSALSQAVRMMIPLAKEALESLSFNRRRLYRRVSAAATVDCFLIAAVQGLHCQENR